MNVEDFIAAIKEQAPQNRQTRINKSLASGQVFLNFINLPHGYGAEGGGAEAENNRSLLSISGFAKDGSIPGKLKVEQLIKLKVEHEIHVVNLRGKTAKPEIILGYVVAYLNECAKVPPHYTHSTPPGE